MMKCPECIKLGLRSKIFAGMSSGTLMCCHPFYDEDGVYHHHDYNKTTTNYSCSNGHSWSETIRNQCPACGYEWDDVEVR